LPKIPIAPKATAETRQKMTPERCTWRDRALRKL
jgi:hypothetical protein